MLHVSRQMFPVQFNKTNLTFASLGELEWFLVRDIVFQEKYMFHTLKVYNNLAGITIASVE